jgi:hypothetical protein
MQILRTNSLPISITYDVPEASSDYIVVISDSERNIEIERINGTSDLSLKINIELPELFNKYDESYHLSIYEDDAGDLGQIVVEDNLEINRPYVDPRTLGTTATEISEYTKFERLSRSIIDSITGGFYFTTDWIETVGQGTDYLPLWNRSYKVLKVYQNSKLVFDINQNPSALDSWNYNITQDMTAIVKSSPDGDLEFNRAERKPPRMAIAASDSIAFFDTEDSSNFQTFQSGVTFGEGVDYLISLEVGYKVIPYDIKEATLMLIDDLKCGRLDYYKRYVTNYSNDQYRIQFDKTSFVGTGNILVDKILEKYTVKITQPGVL